MDLIGTDYSIYDTTHVIGLVVLFLVILCYLVYIL